MKDAVMNHNQRMTITLLAATILVLGCNQEPSTSQQVEKLQTETREAAQDMKDYTYAQKSEFTAKMQGELAKINTDLDQLAARIEKSSDAVKAEATPKLRALRVQADKLNKQLGAAKGATESTWDDIKAGTRKAYQELKEGFQQARHWVSEKIAP